MGFIQCGDVRKEREYVLPINILLQGGGDNGGDIILGSGEFKTNSAFMTDLGLLRIIQLLQWFTNSVFA
jgi:hypothetical protein